MRFFNADDADSDGLQNNGFADHLAKMYPESVEMPDIDSIKYNSQNSDFLSKFGRLNPGDFNPFFAKSEADSNNLRLIAVVAFISVIFVVVVYAILLAALNLKKVKAYKNSASPMNTTDVRPSICVSVQRSENSSFRGSISTNASGFSRSSVGMFNAGLIATDINAAWKPLSRVQS